MLWSFIENYYPKLKKEENPLLINMLEYGVQYYNKFVLPNKKYRLASDKEKEGFSLLIEVLKNCSPNEEPENIQTKIYEIGMSLNFENLKDWFSAFYQVVLGQDQGPRLGSFIKFYGINETIKLLERKLNNER
jgi:lysyl-tRNA synthetase class 1